MRYDYLFVGAGPASLAAANYLLDCGVSNILIVEEGGPFQKRGCPGLKRQTCLHCNGNSCHVTAGEGGCSASFGNKLCHFPASDKILNHFKPSVVSASHNYLDQLLDAQFTRERDGVTKATGSARFLEKKNYESDVLLKNEFEDLTLALLAAPRKNGVIKLNTGVEEIARLNPHGYRTRLSSGESVEAARVVLGCGRTSHAFLRRTYQQLGIEYEDNCQDIGIRIEARADVFTNEYTYQTDPKYKFAHPYGSCRTFCACNGGVVAPVKFGDSYYAEGAFGQEFTKFNNVAFMVRSKKVLSASMLEHWCNAVNNKAMGNLLLGTVEFEDIQSVVTSILAMIPVWPSSDHRAMMCDLLALTLGDEIALLKRGATMKIYGPAIDLYWPKPALGAGLMTGLSDLYVIGDATGVSRGFVQAMTAGAAWGVTQQFGMLPAAITSNSVEIEGANGSFRSCRLSTSFHEKPVST